MKLGYACINTDMPSKIKTCRLKTVEEHGMIKVKDLAVANLKEVIRILRWNVDHQIFFFRLSSEIIPFASHPIMDWDWQSDQDIMLFAGEIKKLQLEHDLRLTMHPGQYTILNSPREQVVKNAKAELLYHQQLLDLIGGSDIILHVGGAYGDKEKSKQAFVREYVSLPEKVKALLRVENDDKIYTAEDVLDIYDRCGVPVCFDIHHHNCNHEEGADLSAILDRVFSTWKDHGKPKMHISSGRQFPTDRSHHDFVLEEDFLFFLKQLNGRDVDVMLEAKQKQEAVLRARSW